MLMDNGFVLFARLLVSPVANVLQTEDQHHIFARHGFLNSFLDKLDLCHTKLHLPVLGECDAILVFDALNNRVFRAVHDGGTHRFMRAQGQQSV